MKGAAARSFSFVEPMKALPVEKLPDVAQVKFTESTLDDQLRQPVFLGLRTDKEAKEVVRG
jgi:ATP-dependent DNA ligase